MKTCAFCGQSTNSTMYHKALLICPDCLGRLKENPQVIEQDVKAKRISAAVCRWMARIVGTLVVVMMMVFAIGEGVDKEFAVQVSFWGIALAMIGNLLGWRFELAGGILALVGVFLVFVSLLCDGLFLPGFYIVLALPGALYTASALLRRHLATKGERNGTEQTP